MAMTVPVLSAGLARIAAHMEVVADELNALDGQLGDGDLGVTMVRGGREVDKALPTLPADFGMALMACAQAFTRASGSSYGTLLATALLSAAKATKGRTEVPWSEVPALLQGALDAMMVRGKASLGDKTVLDTIDAAIKAMQGMDDPEKMLTAAAVAVESTVETMRHQPAKVGRARIFADKSIGLHDPGQMAFREILRGLGK
jgi:phosphoenolpyruvate---glycerone phosphotransferase subunit DhaL